MKISLTLMMMLMLAISFSSMKCEKEETDKTEKLPEETQTGRQTFGCLVNGEVWLPKGAGPYSNIIVTIQNNILNIGVARGIESIGVRIRDLNSTGEYLLPANNSTGYTKDEVTYSPVEGKITITKYDRVSQIISGRFEFRGKDEGGTIVNVTDGRFDLKYTN